MRKEGNEWVLNGQVLSVLDIVEWRKLMEDRNGGQVALATPDVKSTL
jgi:hypothetical protein